MQNTNLDEIWRELEVTQKDSGKRVQRLVFLNLLYRTYIGVKNVPRRKYLILEVPLSREHDFSKFFETRGLELNIQVFGNEKPGFISCELSSSSSDMNDIFGIVAQDILHKLIRCEDETTFIKTLKKTIDLWKDFFAEKPKKIITGKNARGLFGELQFMDEVMEEGFGDIVKMWNGPLKTAQDFQSQFIASEIKTTLANTIDIVTVADLAQLYKGERQHLFLVAYRLELDGDKGMTIPDIINKLEKQIPEEDKKVFDFKLEARGYNADLADQYDERFRVQERKCYEITEGFPCLTVESVPDEVMEVEYKLRLRSCSQYSVEFQKITNNYKG